MTRFSDLNDDILHEIIGWLQLMKERDPSAAISLPQLARVCLRIGALVPRHLVKAMNIQITASDVPKLRLLMRSLKETPGLRALVRKIQITLGFEPLASFWANELLQQLPNLVYLEIQRALSNIEDLRELFAFSPNFFQINKLEKLRRVNFQRETVSFATIFDCMSLPNVELIDFSIRTGETFEDSKRASDLTSISQSCRVKTLNLNDSRTSLDLFQALLRRCPYLQHLTGSMPRPFRSTGPGIILFSAAQLQHALAPTRDTLVSLDLLNLQSHTSHPTPFCDGTKLDLKMFSSLESITLPVHCFFNRPVPHDSRNGTYAQFPWSMTKLNLYFAQKTNPYSGKPMNILHSNDQERAKLRSGNAAFEPWTYAWIMEFAYHKATHFPKLHSLTVEEELTGPDMSLVRWSNEDAMKVWTSVGAICNVLFREP
ncbi:uncharacterized protein BDZ99DRAFT_525414 [Mytilinidion resinicola]|uniref:F-box domain-containing protein n=1 Tax=Mytilinidion resinicola TaxID=574789 RepID=A0A6A6Y7B3_9PEZI|nr:uncharacterized protein BDZ99DRAFT_525414 [Mytilinidion resinicola]KAF2804580.1 hypothetical protein BDZ99DRAFT_525414 [Mytilinidion resinicola]